MWSGVKLYSLRQRADLQLDVLVLNYSDRNDFGMESFVFIKTCTGLQSSPQVMLDQSSSMCILTHLLQIGNPSTTTTEHKAEEPLPFYILSDSHSECQAKHANLQCCSIKSPMYPGFASPF